MKLRFVLFVLLLPWVARTQPAVYMSTGSGTYFMSDMDSFQKELLKSVGFVPMKIVSSFPSALHAEVGFIRRFDGGKKTVGGYANYIYTRGRMQYADYSGRLRNDLALRRYCLGGRLSRRVSGQFSMYGKVGLSISTLDIIVETVLNNRVANKESRSFIAYGINFEPGLQWEYPFKRFSFYTSGGFELNVNGKTMYGEQGYLIDEHDDPVRIDWTGLRIAVGVMFRLRREAERGT